MLSSVKNTLEPALFRPGRIDREIYFGKCDAKLIRQYLGKFYLLEESAFAVPDNEHATFAELLNARVCHIDDPSGAVQQLCNSSG